MWVIPRRPTTTATIQKWCLLLTGDVRSAYGPLMQGTFFLCQLCRGFIVQGADFLNLIHAPHFINFERKGGGIQWRTIFC